MSNGLLKFFEMAAKLKTLRRAGWHRCGVSPCESVAEHTFGVAILALLLPGSAGLSVDRNRCVAMALVHDLAESIVGDLTPHDPVTAEEKQRREQAAIDELAKTLGDESARSELVELWEEFAAAQTPEAQLVRDLDVIEMAWQACAYRESGRLSAPAAEKFLESSRNRIRTEAGRALLQQITRDSPPIA